MERQRVEKGRAMKCIICGLPFSRKNPRQTGCGPRCRLLSKIEKSDSCWLWMAARNNFGYGMTSIGKRQMGAHRAAWILFRGEIPSGLRVLHKCDTPACINPDHLFLGTDQDNADDKRAKGRLPLGERLHNAKLTVDAVRAIRRSNLTDGELARIYGVGVSTVQHARDGRHWRQVTP